MIVTIVGGGISNSQVITEENKYSLDAVQNNPNVPGSLRNGIESVSGKVDTYIVNAWNDFSNNGVAGYIKLITIKIVSTYVNYPLRFTVIGRGCYKPISLAVLFNGAGDIDPGVNKYIFEAGVSNPNNYKFYIAKEAASIWSIYASKSQWATVAVTTAEIFRMKKTNFFEITYLNVFVDSLPDGSLEFVVE